MAAGLEYDNHQARASWPPSCCGPSPLHLASVDAQDVCHALRRGSNHRLQAWASSHGCTAALLNRNFLESEFVCRMTPRRTSGPRSAAQRQPVQVAHIPAQLRLATSLLHRGITAAERQTSRWLVRRLVPDRCTRAFIVSFPVPNASAAPALWLGHSHSSTVVLGRAAHHCCASSLIRCLPSGDRQRDPGMSNSLLCRCAALNLGQRMSARSLSAGDLT